MIFWLLLACQEASEPPKVNAPPKKVPIQIPIQKKDSMNIAYSWNEFGQDRKMLFSYPKKEVEKEWAEFGLSEEEVQKIAQSAELPKKKGWTIERKQNELVISPNFSEQIPKTEDLQKLAKKIGTSPQQYRRVFQYAQFIRSFEYRNVDSYANGRMIGGLQPITQTLVEKKGDCDSLSMAFVSLLQWEEDISVVFLKGMVDGVPHLVAGVSIQPVKGDLVIEYKGQNYVVFDMTIANQSSEKQKLLLGGEFDIEEIWIN